MTDRIIDTIGEDLFSEVHAAMVEILTLDKIYHDIDGEQVFVYWDIKVMDRRQNTYAWRDVEALEDSNLEMMKSKIVGDLLKYVKKVTYNAELDDENLIVRSEDPLSGKYQELGG